MNDEIGTLGRAMCEATREKSHPGYRKMLQSSGVLPPDPAPVVVICGVCRKVHPNGGCSGLTPDQERINALEERVTRLESLVSGENR